MLTRFARAVKRRRERPTKAAIRGKVFELLRLVQLDRNIRQFGAVIDRAAILGDGQHLEIAAALGLSTPHAPLSQTPAVVKESDKAGTFVQIVPLDEAMKRHIEAALSITQAASKAAAAPQQP